MSLYAQYDETVSVKAVVDRISDALGFEYQILEKPEKIVFEKFEERVKRDQFDTFHRGRLFGDHADLRWCLRKNGRHIVLITDNSFADESPLKDELADFETQYEARPTQYYLWGKFDGKRTKWLEGRIPIELDYPLEGKKTNRVAITAFEYQNKETGVIEFIRFIGLIGV